MSIWLSSICECFLEFVNFVKLMYDVGVGCVCVGFHHANTMVREWLGNLTNESGGGSSDDVLGDQGGISKFLEVFIDKVIQGLVNSIRYDVVGKWACLLYWGICFSIREAWYLLPY